MAIEETVWFLDRTSASGVNVMLLSRLRPVATLRPADREAQTGVSKIIGGNFGGNRKGEEI